MLRGRTRQFCMYPLFRHEMKKKKKKENILRPTPPPFQALYDLAAGMKNAAVQKRPGLIPRNVSMRSSLIRRGPAVHLSPRIKGRTTCATRLQ